MISPSDKKLIQSECENLLAKLTDEYRISPSMSALVMAEYLLLNVASTYLESDKKIPKDLTKFLETHLPKIFEGNKELIQRQTLLLNTKGTA